MGSKRIIKRADATTEPPDYMKTGARFRPAINDDTFNVEKAPFFSNTDPELVRPKSVVLDDDNTPDYSNALPVIGFNLATGFLNPDAVDKYSWHPSTQLHPELKLNSTLVDPVVEQITGLVPEGVQPYVRNTLGPLGFIGQDYFLGKAFNSGMFGNVAKTHGMDAVRQTGDLAAGLGWVVNTWDAAKEGFNHPEMVSDNILNGMYAFGVRPGGSSVQEQIMANLATTVPQASMDVLKSWITLSPKAPRPAKAMTQYLRIPGKLPGADIFGAFTSSVMPSPSPKVNQDEGWIYDYMKAAAGDTWLYQPADFDYYYRPVRALNGYKGYISSSDVRAFVDDTSLLYESLAPALRGIREMDPATRREITGKVIRDALIRRYGTDNFREAAYAHKILYSPLSARNRARLSITRPATAEDRQRYRAMFIRRIQQEYPRIAPELRAQIEAFPGYRDIDKITSVPAYTMNQIAQQNIADYRTFLRMGFSRIQALHLVGAGVEPREIRGNSAPYIRDLAASTNVGFQRLTAEERAKLKSWDSKTDRYNRFADQILEREE